jgi:EpsI family protein
MKLGITAVVVAALMASASVASIGIRSRAPDPGLGIVLETAVPRDFGDWTALKSEPNQVVNPQTEALLKSIYSQILTRTYVHKDGYRIMLSLAYGDDQTGGLQAHRPEICYPAQGFRLTSQADAELPTAYGPIEVRRLTTVLKTRREPVTYWLTIGDEVIRDRMQKRLAAIRLAFTGQIPDGLLFRASSIDEDHARAFAMQQRFVSDLMSAIQDPETRRKLSGLSTPAKAS